MKTLPPRKVTRRELVIDNYHGKNVADPYRWLEDDNAPEVQEWMAAQNSDFEAYMSAQPARKALKDRLTQLWHFAKAGPPHYHKGHYYTWRNNGLQNQSVLYRSPNLNDTGEVIFDPNTLSDDGTIAVGSYSYSPGGNYFAYSLSASGSDWQTIKVLNLNTLENCPDNLEHAKFTNLSWLPDESGFFYTRYPDPKTSNVLEAMARNSMVCLHSLGQPQNQDKIIHQDAKNPDWVFTVKLDDSKQWIFLSVGAGSTLRCNKLFFKPLDKLDSPWLPIAADFVDGGYEVIGVIDNTAYISTQNEAPFGKVVSVDLSESGMSNLKTIIPDQGEMLEGVKLVNNHLLCTFLHHASSRLKLHDLKGMYIQEIPLPSVGSIHEISAENSWKECFIQFSSFLFPDAILRYDCKTGETTTLFSPKIDFPVDDYETVQKFCTSKDGTQVPVFITHKKGLTLDGSHPTLLFGYGGFNICITPNFAVPRLAWLEAGGIYAQACMRGGAEYGEAWHRAGMLESKQNVFDDFIAAGEYLISEKYTRKEKLSIYGRSNGGLLTGACVTQRPDLFGAVIVQVPVLDMYRYQLFTSGRFWVGEYGSAEDPDQFLFLQKYSPLHNVKMNTVYPPTLIMTADTDDRVVPSQARKFAATMQAADGGENPILIRIEKSAGHGVGKPVSKVIDEMADLYGFLMANLC